MMNHAQVFAGRADMMASPFNGLERGISDDRLADLLGPGGWRGYGLQRATPQSLIAFFDSPWPSIQAGIDPEIAAIDPERL
jgi:hypothetical protein